MASPQPCIPGLLSPVVDVIDPVTTEIRTVKAHKRQRGTAVGAYVKRRDEDIARAKVGKETREGQVLRCSSAYFNKFQRRPTALELMRWMKGKGEGLFDINSIRPRITALVKARLMKAYKKRACRVSGVTVCTWGAVER